MTDGRTREGQEKLVLQQVEKHGGFSVFWATEHQKRAHAICRLHARVALMETGA